MNYADVEKKVFKTYQK